MPLIEIPEKLSPKFHAHWAKTLNYALENGNLPECETTLTELQQRFPEVPAFHRDLARVMRNKGDFWSTARAWNKFLEMSPAVKTGHPVLYANALASHEAVLDGVRMVIGPEWKSLNDQVRFVLVEDRYEKAERQGLNALLGQDDRVLECGAGAGYLGICAKRLFPDISYTAVEANVELFPLIEANQQLNNVSFKLIQGAVGAWDDQISFVVYDSFMGSQSAAYASGGSSPAGEGRRITVHQLGLAGLLTQTGANFLIMDVEGAEYECLIDNALPGVNKLLVEFHPLVLGRKRISALLRHLLGIGFELEMTAGSRQVYCFFRDLPPRS